MLPHNIIPEEACLAGLAIGPSTESVDFHTPTSVLGVRGTEFVVEVAGDRDE